ncbi:FbpB family small basic protein [Pseudalkalibacillus berkeleyi]|uniref:FbpB family small basic protein n=1 Tax=Pseudalkalibacillus berkeleyi TaxID=1069813 RepID=A0ABS9GUX5_9BACL|nr:FbpB family small basic protein [Pseudalkalibacillus berkeleyi]MCF6136494.1 FbpB family small basic protein [Pseudalkalibacillus berkeleyi]
MGKRKTSFEELFIQNRDKLINDPKEMEKIEKKIEKKQLDKSS